VQIDIVEDKENKLLERREIKFIVKRDGATPSLKVTRKELTTILSADPKLLVIDNMKSEFGKRETIGYAKVYESEEREKEVESSHILLRNFPSSEKKEGASEATEKAVEVPIEEKSDLVTEGKDGK